MMQLEPAGPCAAVLYLAEEPYPGLPQKMARLALLLREQLGFCLVDVVPAWTSLLIHYRLDWGDYPALVACLQPLLDAWEQQELASSPEHLVCGAQHELPICYDGEDLSAVASACGLAPTEVIRLHSSRCYEVGAVGFAPGFAYLGSLDARLVLPRRSTPRQQVPAGSLAIAEQQTAIYPQSSPGGWHLLGRCPLPLFSSRGDPACRLQVGDQVRFLPIDASTCDALVQEATWA